jgi:hypothetical protein
VHHGSEIVDYELNERGQLATRPARQARRSARIVSSDGVGVPGKSVRVARLIGQKSEDPGGTVGVTRVSTLPNEEEDSGSFLPSSEQYLSFEDETFESMIGYFSPVDSSYGY